MNRKLIVIFLLCSILGSCKAQDRLISGEAVTTVEEKLAYYLYYPKEYTEAGQSFGLLLFLHGGGEAGGALEAIKKNGPPKALANGTEFPFLVLAPQNPYRNQWWNIHAVKVLLDTIIKENNVDPSKIYLSGLSRGGSAAWNLAVNYPNTFAALMVVCGMAPTPYAHWLDKQLPIWVFHGVEDKVIPVSESDKMVARLKELGFDIIYDRYENIGHDAWVKAYQTRGLYEWMNSKSRKK